ncbi:MAG: hypothetical protein O2807_09410 [bacterium]|nr:hypothetical protein [bacterium]
MAEGWALADAVRFATAAAALSVQKKGAQTGLARRPGILRWMRALRVSPVRAG